MSPSRLSLLALCIAACSPPAHIGGAPSTAPAPSTEWPAQKTTGASKTFDKTETARATRGSVVPAELATRMDHLSIDDLADPALGNTPQPRAPWPQARAAASAYGSARGHLLPSLELDGSGGPSKAISFNPAELPSTG